MKHIIAIRAMHALVSLICLSVILPSMRAYAEQSRGVTGLHIENGWMLSSVTGVSDEATRYSEELNLHRKTYITQSKRGTVFHP